jgi:hypothetical protein
MRKWFVIGSLLACSAVFAGYKIGANLPGADFVIDAVSDSEHTTMTTLNAYSNGDENCTQNKHGFSLGSDHTFGHAPALKVRRIAADERFAFTATYNEARGPQVRMCSLSAAFTPAADRRYLARIVTTDQVDRCDLGIFDVTDGTARPIDFKMPEFVCGKKTPTQQPNGKPVTFNVPIVVPLYY